MFKCMGFFNKNEKFRLHICVFLSLISNIYYV